MKFDPLVILTIVSTGALLVIIVMRVLREVLPKAHKKLSIVMPGALLQRNQPGLQRPVSQEPLRPAILPINIEQDAIPAYSQIGFIHQENSESLPLFGRAKYLGSQMYEYYVKGGTRNQIMIPIDTPKSSNNELYDEDTVQVKSLEGDYSVSLYDREDIRYIPYM